MTGPEDLVQDDEAQPLEKLGPLSVMRQDARVEHVGIGDQDTRRTAYLRPRGRRGVTVVGRGRDGRPPP